MAFVSLRPSPRLRARLATRISARLATCLLLASAPVAAAAPLHHLLRTPAHQVRPGDAAAALAPVLEAIRAADRAAVRAWLLEPVGEGPIDRATLDTAAAAIAMESFAHPQDPLDDRPDPDLEALRTLGWLLAAEARRRGARDGAADAPGELQTKETEALADAPWRAAAEPLRAAVRLGHHLGRAPGLTRVLVGVSIHQQVLRALETLAGRPGIPNLHDTLADLAFHSIDVRPAAWIQMARPALNDPLLERARAAVESSDPLPDAAWDDLLHRLVLGLALGLEPDEGAPLPPLSPELAVGLASLRPLFEPLAPAGTQPASRRLIEGVLAEWNRQRSQAWADTLVPHHVLRERGARQPEGTLTEQLIAPYVSTPLPGLAGAADLARRLAALQGAEALRAHAARHAALTGQPGRFPATLAEADPPVPVDPFTGQPPRYRVDAEGLRASLAQESLPGDIPERAHRHELNLRPDPDPQADPQTNPQTDPHTKPRTAPSHPLDRWDEA